MIGSKWGYAYVADFRQGADVHEVKEHSVARLAEQWPQTQHDLGGQIGRASCRERVSIAV